MARPGSRGTEVFTHMARNAGQRPWCLIGDWKDKKGTAMGRSGEASFLAEGSACAKSAGGKE